MARAWARLAEDSLVLARDCFLAAIFFFVLADASFFLPDFLADASFFLPDFFTCAFLSLPVTFLAFLTVFSVWPGADADVSRASPAAGVAMKASRVRIRISALFIAFAWARTNEWIL
ncbi:MAG: hypothetical protein MUC79_05360 [Thiobacillaceae bacterium]|nr:hypothetical protein [Thiobacillaceae bacterium]